MTRQVAVAALAWAWLAGSAAAQDVRRTEPVVVTATKIETPAEELGATVTVVDGEEIERRHYSTIDEALRHVPGVDIRRSGSLGKTTSISIRGASANQVQVLVDGVRVKSATTGQAELADIAPDMIERIEVIRGPQSTLYGADAIGGVVHVITKRGRGPFAAWASQEAGNHETLRSRAGFSGAWRWFDYAAGYYHLESNGSFPNDDVDQDAAGGRFGISLPGDTRIGAAVRFNRTESGTPVEFTGLPSPIVPTRDPNTRQVTETLTSAIDVRTRPVSWWEGELRVARFHTDLIVDDRPDPFPCPPASFGPPCDFPATFQTLRHEAEALSHFHVGGWSTSTFGLEWRGEEADVRGASVFAPRMETVSGLFQQQFRFFDRLFMSAGVRVEDSDVFGRSTTERGSLAYLVKEWGTRLRGSAGSGFRAPTFNDLFFPGFSNPGLEPERSFSWDVGVDQKVWHDRVRLGVTYFNNRFTKLIACCVPIATFPFVATANIGRARSEGIEATSEVDVLRNLTVGVNYTYTDSENLVTGTPLVRQPRHRWSGRVAWEPTRRLSLFGEAHAVSRQFETVAAGRRVYNSGHTRLDAGGTWRIAERVGYLKAVEIIGRIDNLLDEEYAEVRGFPAAGITGLLGVRVYFP